MSSFTVVITDHGFESLDIESEVLEDLAEVRDLTEVSGQSSTPS